MIFVPKEFDWQPVSKEEEKRGMFKAQKEMEDIVIRAFDEWVKGKTSEDNK